MLNIWQSTLIFICVGGLLSLGACTDQTDKPGATSVTHTAAPGSRLVAPAVEFPADREPSWVTSLQPQPATDPVAVADLQRLGLEFTGKHYVEAAIAGDQAAVELFLQAGMFVDTRSLGGQSALMGAAANGHLEIVKLLVQNGADLTLRESRTSELTPLLYAVMGGHSEIAGFLLAEGADPNAYNAHLETPLFVAATQQYVESVRVLLENGAEVDAATLRDTTPLTYAAGYPSL